MFQLGIISVFRLKLVFFKRQDFLGLFPLVSVLYKEETLLRVQLKSTFVVVLM